MYIYIYTYIHRIIYNHHHRFRTKVQDSTQSATLQKHTRVHKVSSDMSRCVVRRSTAVHNAALSGGGCCLDFPYVIVIVSIVIVICIMLIGMFEYWYYDH